VCCVLLLASPSDTILNSIDYPTFIHIHLNISFHLYMQVYISYSVMAILVWIVLVCDNDSTIVTVKLERMKLSDTTQSPLSRVN